MSRRTDSYDVDQFEGYYQWLCGHIDRDDTNRKTYRQLLRVLWNLEFFWTINDDENRNADGCELRYRYLLMIGDGTDACAEDLVPCGDICRVLEVLIAIAKRTEWTRSGYGIHEWFWELVENLGLKDFADEWFDEKSGEDISRILDKWMAREFSRNGRGSIFPLAKKHVQNGVLIKDMREVSIFSQMTYYLMECYPLEF